MKSEAEKKVEDLEAELELDLENVKLDDNIDTSVSTLGLWKLHISLLLMFS